MDQPLDDLGGAGAVGAAHLDLARRLDELGAARGALGRHDEGPLVAGALLGERGHDLGITSPARCDHPVADAKVLAGDVLLVVEVASLTVAPPTTAGSSSANGTSAPVRPVHLDVVEGRRDRRGGELVGDRPAGAGPPRRGAPGPAPRRSSRPRRRCRSRPCRAAPPRPRTRPAPHRCPATLMSGLTRKPAPRSHSSAADWVGRSRPSA